jgi:cobalt-zinc-cadmium efflux system protein
MELLHKHDHHSHPHTPHSFNNAFAFSVVLNFAFSIIQIIYALHAHSMGLMADAVHNFGDVLGLALAWGANWMVTLPARKRYSYGFKRISILAAITNALILFATSTLITYHSLHNLFRYPDVNEKIIIVVAFVGIFINGGTALLFRKGAHEDLNIKGAFLHLVNDALISFGVVISGVLIFFTGKMWIDPIVGLLIVTTILWGTWGLLRDSVHLILDAIPHYIDHHGIREYLQNFPGVTALHDLHIWGLSTKETALTAHLVIPERTITDEDYKKINQTLREQFKINHATIQVEKGSKDHPCEQSEVC